MLKREEYMKYGNDNIKLTITIHYNSFGFSNIFYDFISVVVFFDYFSYCCDNSEIRDNIDGLF